MLTKIASLLSLPVIFFGMTFTSVVQAADHGDAPGVRLDLRLDINDVYAFQSPSNAANTVLIMTTNPQAGILSPLAYNPSARYEIVIDDDGDAKEDLVFRFKFEAGNLATPQRMSVHRLVDGKTVGKRIGRGTTGTNVTVKLNPGTGTAIAGNFDDPFFFDLLAFRNNLAFSSSTARNFFKGLNTLAIVLEVPSSSLHGKGGDTNIGVWGRTILRGRQIDRNGRPAINTVLVAAAKKDAFNKAKPANDAAFRADAITVIKSLGNSEENATSLATTLFPDILTFNTASASGFLNGRRLEDDVIDAELALLTGNNAASDFVANDSTFSTTFPYLAAKNP